MPGSLAQRVLHSGGSSRPLGLSERDFVASKSSLGVCFFLASSLGESRCSFLEALQNADEMLALTAKTGVGQLNWRNGLSCSGSGALSSRFVSGSGSQLQSDLGY